MEWFDRSDSTALKPLKQPPWALAQVCPTWRASILSLPRLWTTFILDYPPPRTPTSTSFRSNILHENLEPLLTQLRHCQDQPIAVFIDYNEDIPAIRNALTILGSDDVISRWLDATIYFHVQTPGLLQPYTKRFCNLSTLHLYFLEESWDNQTTFIDLQDAPRLRNLSIWGQYDTNDSGLTLKLPWKQITRYTARDSECYFTSSEFHYAILPLLENVQECWLDCVLFTDGPVQFAQVQSPLGLLYLHTLILSSAGVSDASRYPSGIGQFLDQTSLPALRVLKFRNGLPGDTRSLRNMLERSRCSLYELVMFDLEDHDDSCEDFDGLLHLNSLKSLHILTIGSKDPGAHQTSLRILDTLTIQTEVESSLPNLRVFQTNYPYYRLPWEGLSDMVYSRRRVHFPTQSYHHSLFERLVIRAHGESTKTQMEETWIQATQVFRKLCVEGLVLERRGAGFF
ncbi:hypothetical protein PM082_014637 [Marasmius tenuissimus]|nr:hypothetical protein PM082_014637 [Marasmius tenuissimus]